MRHCSSPVNVRFGTQDRNEPLDRDVEIGDIMQDKVDERFVSFLPDELDEGLRLQRLSESVGSEPVLGKAKVKFVQYL